MRQTENSIDRTRKAAILLTAIYDYCDKKEYCSDCAFWEKGKQCIFYSHIQKLEKEARSAGNYHKEVKKYERK